MIIITSLNRTSRLVEPGDEFQLSIGDSLGHSVLISEVILVKREIDFIASFRFALEDGTCPGFHLTGIFANSKELPDEIKNAKRLEDLTPEQYSNFIRTVGTYSR